MEHENYGNVYYVDTALPPCTSAGNNFVVPHHYQQPQPCFEYPVSPYTHQTGFEEVPESLFIQPFWIQQQHQEATLTPVYPAPEFCFQCPSSSAMECYTDQQTYAEEANAQVYSSFGYQYTPNSASYDQPVAMDCNGHFDFNTVLPQYSSPYAFQVSPPVLAERQMEKCPEATHSNRQSNGRSRHRRYGKGAILGCSS